jgi:hypothetical protein
MDNKEPTTAGAVPCPATCSHDRCSQTARGATSCDVQPSGLGAYEAMGHSFETKRIPAVGEHHWLTTGVDEDDRVLWPESASFDRARETGHALG